MPAAKKTTEAVEPVAHKNLAAALAAFQAEVPNVHKGKTADTGKYKYRYADLADVASAAYPVLAKHGLSFTARPEFVDGSGFVLVGVLRHESGESDEGVLPIQGRDAQAIGSSLTYNRRYLLGCMTGIVTDEDDDGQRAAKARDSRPESEVAPSQAMGGSRQTGRAQQERRLRTGDGSDPAEAAPQASGPDPAVVKAQTIAVTNAGDLQSLRAAYDEACRSGAINAIVDDPDHQGNRVPLSEIVNRRKAAMTNAA